ncbi:MAG: preprotein translocase subunit SecE [Acidimicrobiales bacterium]
MGAGPGTRAPAGRGGQPGRTAGGGAGPGTGQSLPERTTEYAREVRNELVKVAWPGRPEVVNYAIVVFVTLVLLTAIIFGLDYGFAKGVLLLFNK